MIKILAVICYNDYERDVYRSVDCMEMRSRNNHGTNLYLFLSKYYALVTLVRTFQCLGTRGRYYFCQ